MIINKSVLFLSLMATFAIPTIQADNHNQVVAHNIKGNIHVISGDGGNITVVKDTRGLLMIDAGLQSLSEDMLMTVSDIADSPIKYLVNTHWHFDHAGGNTLVNDAGATIFAHHNVHLRMQKGGTIAAFGREVTPAKQNELPVITFDQGMRFHWGDDIFDLEYMGPAHTDGDSVVFVKDANVVIMGDVYFKSIYPFIDISSGGSMKGTIDSVNAVLERINNDTVLIPGHGGVSSNKVELLEYRDMLQSVYDKIATMKQAGKSIDEVVLSKPTAEFDDEWNDGFLKADTWVKVIYPSI